MTEQKHISTDTEQYLMELAEDIKFYIWNGSENTKENTEYLANFLLKVAEDMKKDLEVFE